MTRRFLVALSMLASLGTALSAQPAAPANTSVTSERVDGRLVVGLEGAQGHFTVRLSHAAIVHGVRFDLVDADGNLVSNLPWEATLSTSAAQGEAGQVAVLDASQPALRVPRPYGIRMGAEDSITIFSNVGTVDGVTTTLRVTIDYELPEGRTSRLAAVALSARGTAQVSGTEDSWTWQPEVGGRLVAVSGRELEGAEALVLEDATTGAVLWHTRAQQAAATQGDLIRPSVTLEQGRAYRLRAIFGGDRATTRGQRGSAPLAVLVPVRGARD
jgi:hypothetical protein